MMKMGLICYPVIKFYPKEVPSMIIKVPATTANLGPGFDSFGLAVSLYLEIELVGLSEKWHIHHELENIPTDDTNLIVKVAKQVFPQIASYELIMRTNIPTARGLGSSSSVIVAGIELANQLGNLKLTNNEKVEIATQIEGHPDNVAPAILGGFVVSAEIDNQVYFDENPFPECGIIAIVPKYELLTSNSRDVLPQNLAFKESIIASNIANMALSFLITNQIEKACNMMELDLFHQPYRRKLIKEFDHVLNLKNDLGFYTAIISGAGPTILVITPMKKRDVIYWKLKNRFSECKVIKLNVDSHGVQVVNNKKDTNP